MSPTDDGLALDDALLSRPEPVSTDQAQALADEHFGISGTAKALTGERDANFRITAEDGRQFVLKAAHWSEGEDVTDLQSQALLHLESSAPQLPLPRTQLTADGHPQVLWNQPNAPARYLRMYSYVEGLPSSEVHGDSSYFEALGAYAGQMDSALENFHHPHDGRPLSWDARRLPQVCPPSLRSPEVSRVIDFLESFVLPRLDTQPEQVIHNDLNPHNIIVVDDDTSPAQVAGLIDFGDLLRAPRVLELGTAGAYHVIDLADPLSSTRHMARGYHTTNPLRGEELEVLPGLVVARVALSLTINKWLAERYPDHAPYLLRNAPRAERALSALIALDWRAAGTELADSVLSDAPTSKEIPS